MSQTFIEVVEKVLKKAELRATIILSTARVGYRFQHKEEMI